MGLSDGDLEGARVGTLDGERDGCALGWVVGAVDGKVVGTLVGASVGAVVIGIARAKMAGALGVVVGASVVDSRIQSPDMLCGRMGRDL